MQAVKFVGLIIAVLAGAACDCQATVARAGLAAAPGLIESFRVVSVHDAFGGRRPPGAAGPYEVIAAVVTGALDPHAAANARIVDLASAPRDARGWVDYRTDVLILRPKQASHARRVLVYDVANRGSLLGKGTFVGGGDLLHGDPPGRDFPSWLEHGYTVVWSGWQGDIPLSGDGTRMGTAFPLAQVHGHPVTGMSREEYIPDDAGGAASTFRLSYPPADPSRRDEVQFSARESWLDAQGHETYDRPSAPVRQWHYVHHAGKEGPGDDMVQFTPPAQVPGVDGAPMAPDAGTIYSFVYRARDSRIDGIGFAAVRDLVGFLRQRDHAASGDPNPLNDLSTARCVSAHCPAHPQTNFDVAVGVGISQSGRFLRDFLYQGFNKGPRGQRVFDGLMPIIAGARRTWVNTRFAQPGRWSKQHEDHFMRGFQFPFAYNVFTDPLTGRRDGLLKACLATRSCPKIMQVDGSLEWWNSAASLVVTDGAGKDLQLPPDVRYYLVPGTGHGGGAGVKDGLSPAPNTMCQFADSPVSEEPFDRALFARLVDWVATDTAPPASRYPTVAEGTAVLPRQAGFPSLKALRLPAGADGTASALSVAFRGRHNQVEVTRFHAGVPTVDPRKRYAVLVPKVDATGNDRGGIRTPAVAVPLASYAGWNLRTAGHAEGELCSSHGAMFPLASTAAMHSADDPRPSLQQLYRGRNDYLRKVDAATDRLVAHGYLLERDALHLYKARARLVAGSLLPASWKN